MENYLYFAEAVVETGDDTLSEALMVPAKNFIKAEPVSATQTAFYFKNALGLKNGTHKVVLTHGSANNKATIKGVMACVNAASGGFVVVADAETGTAANKLSNFNQVFNGDVTAVAISDSPDGENSMERTGTSRSRSYEAGAVSSSSYGGPRAYMYEDKGRIISRIKLDLTGLAGNNDEGDVIGLAAGEPAYIFKHVNTEMGITYRIEMTCVEVPTSGSNNLLDIDLRANSSATAEATADGSSYTALITAGGAWTLGKTIVQDVTIPTDNHYLYLVEGDASGGANTFTAGQFVITLYGYSPFAAA